MASLMAKSLVLSVLVCGLGAAWAQKVPANQITKEQLQEAMNREMTAAVAGLIQSCKQKYPEKSAALDATWARESAAAGPDLQAYMKTKPFAAAVATYKKEQLAQAEASAENSRNLAELCEGLANPSN